MCIFTLISNALAIGFVFTWSVFYDSISASLSLSRVDVTWIGGLLNFSINGLAIPAGIIVAKYVHSLTHSLTHPHTFVHRYNPRAALVIAALLYYVGFSLASSSTSINALYVYIGGFCGFASCITFSAGVQVSHERRIQLEWLCVA